MERPHQSVPNRQVTKGELIAVLFKEILMSHHFDTKLAREDPSLNLCDFYFCLVRRICGRRQAPAACQVHDTGRFP
jgi:hypothetical protein